MISEVDNPVYGATGTAIHTMKHAKGFSKKLGRRLTQLTIAEVKALKQHSAEAVHVLVYVAELVSKSSNIFHRQKILRILSFQIATDPVLAFQKGKELWASLSKDEPENQARPENLEQLIVLLTRESARRIVHLINFSSSIVSTVPRRVSRSVTKMAKKLLILTDSMVKVSFIDLNDQVEF